MPAGEHKFKASCEYYETSALVLTGTYTYKVNLIKGHTYQLTPVPARNTKTKELTCAIITKDLTKI